MPLSPADLSVQQTKNRDQAFKDHVDKIVAQIDEQMATGEGQTFRVSLPKPSGIRNFAVEEVIEAIKKEYEPLGWNVAKVDGVSDRMAGFLEISPAEEHEPKPDSKPQTETKPPA